MIDRYPRHVPRFVDPKRDGPTSENDLELQAQVDSERPLRMGRGKKTFVILFYGLASTLAGPALYALFWFISTEDDRFQLSFFWTETWAFFLGTTPGIISLLVVAVLASVLFAVIVFGRLRFDILALMGTSGALLAAVLHTGVFLTFFLISLTRDTPLVEWSELWANTLLCFGSGFFSGVIATAILGVLFRHSWRKRTYRLVPVDDEPAVGPDRTTTTSAGPDEAEASRAADQTAQPVGPLTDHPVAGPVTVSTFSTVSWPKKLLVALTFGLLLEMFRHAARTLFIGPYTTWDPVFLFLSDWVQQLSHPSETRTALVNIALGSLLYGILVFLWPGLVSKLSQALAGAGSGAVLHASMFFSTELLLEQQRGLDSAVIAKHALAVALHGALYGLLAGAVLAIAARSLWRQRHRIRAHAPAPGTSSSPDSRT